MSGAPERPHGPAQHLRPLLGRRLVIVTGKGGTGKTSVASALALAAARTGRRVMLIETGRDEHAPRLFRPAAASGDAERVGYEGREILPGLHCRKIEPYAALTEYLRTQLHVPGVLARVLKNPGFRQLMDAAPGWRELITLGKVWHLREEQRDGAPAYDLLVVDAPATGHGLVFLDVPRVVVSAVRAGPLQRHAGWVEAMIKDPDSTLLLPVTLAEELPARETAELVDRVRDEIGIAVDRVVVNALPDAPFPKDLEDLDQRLANLAPLPEGVAGLPSAQALAGCARHLRERFELGREYLGRVREWTGLPTQELPYLMGGVSGLRDLERLAGALVREEAS